MDGGNWSDILNETKNIPTRFDSIRHKYLEKLAKKINRNVICYYSGWQQGKNGSIDVNDSDMEGFMSAIKGTNKSKGLSLVLHTPGGDPNAAEAIMNYLRDIFNDDIEIIVPHMAMSAGTMMACASKTIWMGKHSSLGPVDPQFSGIPAYNIISEFGDARDDLAANPKNAFYWNILLSKYPRAFVKSAQDAVELSNELLEKWLTEVMFKRNSEEEKIQRIISSLNEHSRSKAHARHYNYKKIKEIGLKVKLLEENSDLQNAALSLHHAFIITLQQTKASKIIEGPENAYIVMEKR